MEDNDGRRATGHLPELRIRGAFDPVVQVIREADGEILYTQRIQGRTFRPRVFAPGTPALPLRGVSASLQPA